MSFAIAAAGTGGHVYPGLAVGEALVASGVDRADVLYVGGRRLEAEVYPAAGFPTLEVEIRGLSRGAVLRNLALPWLVVKAVLRIRSELRRRRVRVLLTMGGYISPPAAVAARLGRIPVVVSEQNAEAGLGSRLAGRLARRRFGSFPNTLGLPEAEWVGNPVRATLARFDRAALRGTARESYGLDPDTPVVGVFGGSLGAGAINQAVATLTSGWDGPEIQVLHLTGPTHLEAMLQRPAATGVRWHRVGYEDRMDLFYAASDLVVARAGGAVAELSATATPAILVPGGFGSGRHQTENASVLETAGSVVVLAEGDLEQLPGLVRSILFDRRRLEAMTEAARTMARPEAASIVAGALLEMHG